MTNDDKRLLDEIYKIDGFWGIYYRTGYGVYNDERNLADLRDFSKKSKRKWIGAKKFKTYNAALAYAQNGISKMYDMDPAFIPKLKYRLNRTQWISDTYLRGGY